MTRAKLRIEPQRVALSIVEAAGTLGIGPSLFEEDVLPHLRVCFIRGERRIPVAELERWVERNARTIKGRPA